MRPLQKITPSQHPPKCTDLVLLKFEWIPGLPLAIETIPAVVIRSAVEPATGHYKVNVVPFGDGCPDGIWSAPVNGIGGALIGVYYFDFLDGVIPAVAPYPGSGMFGTRRVWAEKAGAA